MTVLQLFVKRFSQNCLMRQPSLASHQQNCANMKTVLKHIVISRILWTQLKRKEERKEEQKEEQKEERR